MGKTQSLQAIIMMINLNLPKVIKVNIYNHQCTQTMQNIMLLRYFPNDYANIMNIIE